MINISVNNKKVIEILLLEPWDFFPGDFYFSILHLFVQTEFRISKSCTFWWGSVDKTLYLPPECVFLPSVKYVFFCASSLRSLAKCFFFALVAALLVQKRNIWPRRAAPQPPKIHIWRRVKKKLTFSGGR